MKSGDFSLGMLFEPHAIPKKGIVIFVNFEADTFLHQQIRGIKGESLEGYIFDEFVLER